MRFAFLERLGVEAAALSEISDGDCGQPSARAAFCERLGLDPSGLVRGRQVHGVAIATVSEPDKGAIFPDTDGLITNVPGVALGVSVADCVPVYLVDPVSRAVGLVHAGREGTRCGIAALAVARLGDVYGSRPADIRALIGPSAGPCCYEVSEQMAKEYGQLGFRLDGRRLDLWDANSRQVLAAGVPLDQIEVARECTICGGRFFSYRRSGGPERNLAVLSCGFRVDA